MPPFYVPEASIFPPMESEKRRLLFRRFSIIASYHRKGCDCLLTFQGNDRLILQVRDMVKRIAHINGNLLKGFAVHIVELQHFPVSLVLKLEYGCKDLIFHGCEIIHAVHYGIVKLRNPVVFVRVLCPADGNPGELRRDRC